MMMMMRVPSTRRTTIVPRARVAALVVEEEEIADACFVQAEENERTGRGDGHRNRKTSNKK